MKQSQFHRNQEGRVPSQEQGIRVFRKRGVVMSQTISPTEFQMLLG